MGIPRLTSHLEPYFESTALACPNGCQTNERSEAYDLTIDGPSLAYYIYYNVLSASTAQSAIDALPPYALLARTVVRYLDELVNRGITILSVYFDGYLPPAKSQIRLERLQSYRSQLSTYHANHSKGAFFKCNTYDSPEADLFSGRPLSRSTIRGLPAAPFLVPAAIEGLRASGHSHLIKLVPGEADASCARDARLWGSLVLTNDSDLLVHDLGSEGAVAFFDQVRIQKCEHCPCSTVVAAHICQPRALASRLGVPSILELGYQIKLDPTAPFTTALRRTKTAPDTEADPEYAEFISEYATSQSTVKTVSDIHRSLPTAEHWHQKEELDPRVSEFVIQALQGQRISQVDVYLPFLMEDPTRGSPWEVSQSVRMIAYSIPFMETKFPLQGKETGSGVVSGTPFGSEVFEHCRRGPSIRPIVLRTYDEFEIEDKSMLLFTHVSKRKIAYGAVSAVVFWRSFAMESVLRYLRECGKALPSDDRIMTVITVSPRREWVDWLYMHLLAQLDAVLYSLRMLWQVISCFAPGTVIYKYLYDALKSLPPLAELFPPRCSIMGTSFDIAEIKKSAFQDTIEPDGMLASNIATKAFDDEDSSTVRNEAMTKEKSKQPRRRRRKNYTAERTPPGPVEAKALASNIYSVLANS